VSADVNMAYSYDRRRIRASDDRLSEWQGLVLDVVKTAQAIAEALDKSTDSDALDAPREPAKELVDDLSSAETCETERDFLANLRAAKASVGKLEAALKLAKRDAKKERDADALEAIADASEDLTSVVRELREIEGEIND